MSKPTNSLDSQENKTQEFLHRLKFILKQGNEKN